MRLVSRVGSRPCTGRSARWFGGPSFWSQYFTELVEQRRRNPTDDLVSRVASNDAEPTLDVDEIVAMIAFLLFAGHETVSGMLGNALVALERFPEQRKLLRENPSLIDNAVEELLRFDPPAQVSGRQATATITIGGKSINKGQNVGLMIAAANRDKRRWSDADELRLDRLDPKPISFGFGAHHCLGAALARMELRLALPPLLNALGDYTIDHTRVKWKRSLVLRGPLSIPLTPMPK
jgi:pimeloyl-[acyl-carrier protein] synthase